MKYDDIMGWTDDVELSLILNETVSNLKETKKRRAQQEEGM
jgi:hypothetical protein